MKYLKYFIVVFLINNAHSQVLNVPEITQEQNQWCWAGVSKCILDYYYYPVEQCEIAEYARQVITWYDFGSTDCCENPNLGCNYWNYNWGYSGSIQDILVHFGNIQNVGVSTALTKPTISTEISEGRPFVIRWGWNSGGGHFVVGHGIIDDNIYYMDPWFGEGLHISNYEWVCYDGNHTWTHTNRLTTKPIQPAPNAPTLLSKTSTSITLNTITGCEYQRDGGTWQTSTTFNGLTPNTTYSFAARKAETETHFASEPSSSAQFTTDEEIGIEDNELNNVIIYSHQNSVYIKNETDITLKSVEIYDITGRIIYQSSINEIETVISLQVSNGYYTVRLISQDEKSTTTKILIHR